MTGKLGFPLSNFGAGLHEELGLSLYNLNTCSHALILIGGVQCSVGEVGKGFSGGRGFGGIFDWRHD